MAFSLRFVLAATVASGVRGLVDIAPSAQTLRVDSDNWNYGQGVWAVTDGKDNTQWHQGNYGGSTATFVFTWRTPERISEILTKTPAGSANYGYRSLKIMVSEDGYGFRTLKQYSNQPCGSSRLLRHSFHQWVTAKELKLVLSDKCGGNHFALSRIQIMADAYKQQWGRAVVEVPFVGEVEQKNAIAMGLGASLVAVLGVVGGLKLWRSKKVAETEPLV